jgi:TonB family protein
VFSAWTRWSLVSLACAAAAGCAVSEFVSERAVENPTPPLKAGVYDVKSVDTRPVATREVEPDYPFALQSVLTGQAVVLFTVRADGKVADTSVVEADDVLFGEAAVSAIQKWRFHPALVKGSPVDCRMTLPFVFTSPYAGSPGGDSGSAPPNGAPPDGSRQTTIEPR